MDEVVTNSDTETKNLAKKITKEFKDKGGVIALIGDLGAGKTTFAQGFAEGLGIIEKVISPTFVLIRQHNLPNPERVFYHLDLYRLEDINISELGLEEIFDSVHDNKNIVLIEWAEKISDQLPDNTLSLKFERLSNNTRKVTMTNPNPINSKSWGQ